MVRHFLAVALAIVAMPLSAATRLHADRTDAPVRWMAWGKAALDRSVKEKRPIFLSVAFAASWESEQMHRAAFLVGENAETLNAYFVPVLLDRIEHPETARVYETLAQSMTGNAATPANLVLTPGLEPFAAAGFMKPDELSRFLVINANRWAKERDAVVAEGRANVERARERGEKRHPGEVDATTLEAVVDDIAATYDAEQMAFGGIPRRPHASTISFLLRYAARTRHETIRELALGSLRTMSASALRDQLGGGFHRATRDAAWQQPYFEKMLPDQALLAQAYLEGWRVSGDPDLRHVARTTLDYVVRDLTLHGLIDSAQDAHSLVPLQGPEFMNGAFYRWKTAEVRKLVGNEAAGKVILIYGLSDEVERVPVLQEQRFMKETYAGLATPLALMLEVRQKRPAPFREQGTAGWNGLMISALVRGALLLDEPLYLRAATTAATAVARKLWSPSKKILQHMPAGGEAPAEDYAMLVGGLLDLFEATHDVQWLDLAMTLQTRQDALFWDSAAGRYRTGLSVPASLRPVMLESDEETPSANALAARNLLRLSLLIANADWQSRPAMIFQSFGGRLRSDGARLTALAEAYELSLLPASVVVVAGDPRLLVTQEELTAARKSASPMQMVVLVPHKGAARDRVTRLLPFTRALEAGEKGRPLKYVCARGTCRPG